MAYESMFRKKESPQYQVRVELMDCMSSSGKHRIPEIAREIGIAHQTLLKFILKEHDVELSVLLKIMNYINKQKEKE